MGFIHGKNAEIWLGSKAVTAYLNSLNFKADVDTADTTTFQKTWKTAITGAIAASVDMGGFYDPTLDDVRGTLGVADGVLTVGPGGLLVVGDQARLISAISTAYAETSPVKDAVGFAWSVQADGVAGMGVVLHPLAAEGADANGTDYDSTIVGGTATGAIAHLHVTGLTAGDSIAVKVQDAVTSSFADITGGAFTTVTAVGSQRLVIPGAIRRHLRVVWDVTVAGSNTITFGVAFART